MAMNLGRELERYDRIWLCPSLDRTSWIEEKSNSRRLLMDREQFSDEMIQNELIRYMDPGQAHWRFAVTASGEEWQELYLFLEWSDACDFFQLHHFPRPGYQECIFHQGNGFDSVTLWLEGSEATTLR